MSLWKLEFFVVGSCLFTGCANPLFLVGEGEEQDGSVDVELESSVAEPLEETGEAVEERDSAAPPLDTGFPSSLHDSTTPTDTASPPPTDTSSPPLPDTAKPSADTTAPLDTAKPPEDTAGPTCQSAGELCGCPYPGPCNSTGGTLSPNRCCSGICRNHGSGSFTEFRCD